MKLPASGFRVIIFAVVILYFRAYGASTESDRGSPNGDGECDAARHHQCAWIRGRRGRYCRSSRRSPFSNEKFDVNIIKVLLFYILGFNRYFVVAKEKIYGRKNSSLRHFCIYSNRNQANFYFQLISSHSRGSASALSATDDENPEQMQAMLKAKFDEVGIFLL